jgi:hypothetical protein
MAMFYVNKAKEIQVAKGLTLASPNTLLEKTPVNAVAASGVLTVAGTPVADETLLVGTNLFLFKAARSGAGEITISANNTTQAANIVAALTADSTEVTSTNLAGVVTVVAAAKGVSGNGIFLQTAATGCTVSSVTADKLDGGVDGTIGVSNEICADASYFYHCIAANGITGTNWRRISLGSAF